ncbi:MAG: DUF6048 family protein [Bacteroidales bacterium]
MKRILKRNICSCICSAGLLLILSLGAQAQDTLRTHGPRFGVDVLRAAYYFADPSETSLSFFADMEVRPNLYPVVEVGYSRTSVDSALYSYRSSGIYATAGLDYNFLKNADRRIHHSMTLGFRYGISPFRQNLDNVMVPSGYWGDGVTQYQQQGLTGHWVESSGRHESQKSCQFFLPLDGPSGVACCSIQTWTRWSGRC